MAAGCRPIIHWLAAARLLRHHRPHHRRRRRTNDVHDDSAGVDMGVCEWRLAATRSSVGRERPTAAPSTATSANVVGRLHDAGSIRRHSRIERGVYWRFVGSEQSSAGRRKRMTKLGR